MAKKVLIALLAVIVVGGGLTALWWFRMGPGAPAPEDAATLADEVIRVEVREPEVGSIAVMSEFVGTADPGQQVTVYPKAAGEVLEVSVKAGDSVSVGDVLARIDSKALESSIAQMEAALSSAQARAKLSLEMAEKSLDTNQHNLEEGFDSAIISAQKAVESAEARVDAAKSGVGDLRDDIRDLRDDLLQIPDTMTYETYLEQLQRSLVQAEITLETSEIGLEQANELLRAAEQAKEDQQSSLEDGVAMAELNSNMSDQQIALEKLRDDLENYSVRSQISGVIEQSNVEVYDMASPQAPLFVIADKGAMSVSFSVAESALEYIAAGDPVTVEKNGETAEGAISEISTMADPMSGLYAVKARIENVTFPMHSGSAVKIFASTRGVEGGLLLPIDALYYEAGRPFVYVAIDGAARKTYITTGVTDDTMAEVTGGLTGGESVITSWSPTLGDGVAIAIAEPAASEASETPATEGDAQ